AGLPALFSDERVVGEVSQKDSTNQGLRLFVSSRDERAVGFLAVLERLPEVSREDGTGRLRSANGGVDAHASPRERGERFDHCVSRGRLACVELELAGGLLEGELRAGQRVAGGLANQ